MEKIVKAFPGILAIDNIDLDILQGEIHCLLGENGSGKTTLMNILYGISQPDSGNIYINEKRVSIISPKEAIRHHIGMVHQHFMLVPTFSVTQNIIMGEKNKHEPFLDINEAEKKILEISDNAGLKINPKAKVWQLGVGDQQRVEIVKALYKGAKILILDEPTSVLTPNEAQELFSAIRVLANRGMSVILITHKLEEVMAISSRITVLRRGRKICTTRTTETNKDKLAQQMVGHAVELAIEKSHEEPGETIIEVNKICVKGERGNCAVRDLSLQVRRGEILGIAGVSGNGQEELVDAILGIRTIESGCIQIKGKKINKRSTKAILKMGISCISFDRQKTGLVLSLPIKESLILKSWYQEPFTHGLFLQPNEITHFAEKMIEKFDIVGPGPESKVSVLSGGNQQKVVLAREFSSKPDLIIACNPTTGLDIGASDYVLRQLAAAREQGAAVLLISTELEEVISLSDRIVTIFEGRIIGEVKLPIINSEEIGLMMAGVAKEEFRHG